jgi:hypothetical protein
LDIKYACDAVAPFGRAVVVGSKTDPLYPIKQRAALCATWSEGAISDTPLHSKAQVAVGWARLLWVREGAAAVEQERACSSL